MTDDFNAVTENDFRRYVEIQMSGVYNMLDPRAKIATGLTDCIYLLIRLNYALLMKKFPNVIQEIFVWGNKKK